MSLFSRYKYISILFLSLSLFFSIAAGSAYDVEGEDEPYNALVRIEINDRTDYQALVAAGVQVYAQLYTSRGDPYLLASLTLQELENLRGQGFEVRVLDVNSGGALYYLLYGLPEILNRAGLYVPLLEIENRQAVARLTPSQVKQLSREDLMLKPLVLHPLVVPLEETTLSIETGVTPDPLIGEIVGRVEENRLFYLDGSLSGEWLVTIQGEPYKIKTRYTYAKTPLKKATRYAYEHFQSLDLPTGYDFYTISGVNRRNVIAEQAGSSQPGKIILVVAHLDSISEKPYELAPGGDDNASGSAAVLAIAEILKDYRFDYTLRYVLFTGEEQGYIGSQDYASEVRKAGEDIQAVLNLDMLGYNTVGTAPKIELHTRPNNQGDLAIANLFADTIPAYNVDLVPKVMQDGKSFSDHSSFWEQGYHAIMAIEDWNDHTPYYHKSTDQLEKLNFTYYTEFVKAAIATAAHLGGIQKGELSGVFHDADTGDPIAGAYILATAENGRCWGTNAEADGVYHLTLTPGSYTLFAAAPYFFHQTLIEVEISDGENTSQDFSLQPNPDPLPTYLPLIHIEHP